MVFLMSNVVTILKGVVENSFLYPGKKVFECNREERENARRMQRMLK